MQGRPLSDKVAEIRRWHVQDNGWRDIGYHWLIDRDGTILPGRPEEKAGAHTRGQNMESIGICLIGGHGGSASDSFADNFTVAQETALRGLIADLQEQHPGATVHGHNEFSAKACPCFNAPRWWANKPARKPVQSKTLQASAGGAVALLGGVLGAIGSLDPSAQVALSVGACVALAAFAWIARERIQKWAAGAK